MNTVTRCLKKINRTAHESSCGNLLSHMARCATKSNNPLDHLAYQEQVKLIHKRLELYTFAFWIIFNPQLTHFLRFCNDVSSGCRVGKAIFSFGRNQPEETSSSNNLEAPPESKDDFPRYSYALFMCSGEAM
jgi:hypothetical protein